MVYLITAIHVFVCLFIIVVVLLQSGKGQDLAAAFGGQGSQTAFGPRGAGTLLGKATTWAAVIFMLTSITLSIIASKHVSGFSSVLGTEKSAPTQQAPANPAQNAPAQNK